MMVRTSDFTKTCSFTLINCWNEHEWHIIGHNYYTNLDFANDICLLVELLDFPVQEETATEAASLQFDVN